MTRGVKNSLKVSSGLYDSCGPEDLGQNGNCGGLRSSSDASCHLSSNGADVLLFEGVLLFDGVGVLLFKGVAALLLDGLTLTFLVLFFLGVRLEGLGRSEELRGVGRGERSDEPMGVS